MPKSQWVLKGDDKGRGEWNFVGGLFAGWASRASPSGGFRWVSVWCRLRHPLAYAQTSTVSSIVVQGNQRVEADTIRSYFRAGPNGQLDAFQIDEGVKALFATGLFQDVRPTMQGGRLTITVIENPVINRIAFEGNKKVKDEQLKAEIQSKERGTLSRPVVQADTARLVEVYRRSGRFDIRVEPKIIELPNNRVDLVFEITEGAKTGVRQIDFVGNRAYSSYRLKDVIKTSTTGLLAFLQTGDIYDPDRVEADRELLRRFYLKHGYIDVRIVSAVGEYDPTLRGFVITFTIEEGEQYRVGTAEVQSSIRALDPGIAALAAADLSGRRLQRRGGREDRRRHDHRGGQAGLCLRDGASARDSRSANANGQPCLRRRGRTARLHRTHQRPR